MAESIERRLARLERAIPPDPGMTAGEVLDVFLEHGPAGLALLPPSRLRDALLAGGDEDGGEDEPGEGADDE